MLVLPIVVIAVPSAILVALQWRTARYRKDRLNRMPGASKPFDTFLLPSDVLSSDMYTEEGRRLLILLRIAYVMTAVAWIAGMALLAAQVNS